MDIHGSHELLFSALFSENLVGLFTDSRRDLLLFVATGSKEGVCELRVGQLHTLLEALYRCCFTIFFDDFTLRLIWWRACLIPILGHLDIALVIVLIDGFEFVERRSSRLVLVNLAHDGRLARALLSHDDHLVQPA